MDGGKDQTAQEESVARKKIDKTEAMRLGAKREEEEEKMEEKEEEDGGGGGGAKREDRNDGEEAIAVRTDE